jgi:4-aminobutyrate aminotransferase-like enzyme
MRGREVLDLLRRYESRNVTFLEEDGSWPIVWERAHGVHVWDAEGRKYLDLTSAFGVAAAGHAHDRVVRAGQRQMEHLLHAMGDVHPHALKARLARELSHLTFERWSRAAQGSLNSRLSHRHEPLASGKTIFCNSGFEAVEAALKTALLATGKRGVIAFEGAYHGLGYGALNLTHRSFFRAPFLTQLGRFGHFVGFPTRPGELRLLAATIRRLAKNQRIGAILVEPVQGRGGIRVPPSEFLPLLRRLCDESGALLIADEVFTGFGRTGKWFACEHTGVRPDLICLGKALTGGFPLSACVGQAAVMDAAWPASQGEAMHTSTFLGHPVGCAMALAQIEAIRQDGLVKRSAQLGKLLRRELAALCAMGLPWRMTARGLGLMAGLELARADGQPATEAVLHVSKTMLHRGFILLPEGQHGNVISFTPPLTIRPAQIKRTVTALQTALQDQP